jgi:hypothetical protein
VQNMLIGSGSSVSIVDNPDFIHMLKVLDPKFKVPGELLCLQLLYTKLLYWCCGLAGRAVET